MEKLKQTNMKLLICGSRSITADVDDISSLLDKYSISKPSLLLCGDAKGIDTIAFQWGKKNGITTAVFYPAWDTSGKKAGPLRNALMVEFADKVLAIWDGKSRGTKSTIDLATNKKIPVYIEMV